MKLYIATTSLNFDAIVSTDSVSPASFYKQRGFGISLFYDKASFYLPNSFLLTDAFPIFSINRSEVEHRPMVLEIDDSYYPSFFEKVKDNGDYSVYRTERTLYFSPLSCKIFFLSEADKRATLAKAESILESKYILYVNLGAIRVYDRSIPAIKIGQDSFKKITDSPTPDTNSLREDIRINKAKGFIVSYMIGAGMSITPESARLLRLSKDIKNGIYSLGTKEGKASADALNSVHRLINEAEDLSNDIDPKKKEARNRVVKYLSSIDAPSMLRGTSNEEIIAFLEKIGVYPMLFSRLNNGRLTSIAYLAQQALSSKDEAMVESALADISRYVESIVQHSSPVVLASDLFKLGIDRNYIECHDSYLEKESRDKVEVLFNLYSGYSYKASGIRENRVDYVIDAGREFFSESTEGNQEERKYINDLLDNLEHAASFDMMATDSQALQALAVFMRSPDADIDKMASLIVSNEIPDARIAYGLWGLFYGYSNIPQSFYNKLIQSLNKSEAARFVEQIQEAVFGAVKPELKEKEAPQKNKSFIQKALSFVGLGEKEETQPNQNPLSAPVVQGELWSDLETDTFEDAPQTEEAHVPSDEAKEDKPLNDSLKNNAIPEIEEGEDLPGFDHVFKEIEDIIVSGFSKKEQASYYCSGVKAICSSAISYPALISSLDGIPVLDKTSTNWSKVKRKIRAQIDDIARKEASLLSERRLQSMVSEAAAGNIRQFVTDKFAGEIVKSALPNDDKVRKQLERDLIWFQENYDPSHVEKGRAAYYGSSPRDNLSVITNYERYLRQKREYNPKASWLQEIYLKVDVDAVISALRQVYK